MSLDLTPPALTYAEWDDSARTLTMTFSRPIAAGTVAASAIRVNVGGSNKVNNSTAIASGSTIVVNFPGPGMIAGAMTTTLLTPGALVGTNGVNATTWTAVGVTRVA